VIHLLPAAIKPDVRRKAGAAAWAVCAYSYSLLQCSLHLTVSECLYNDFTQFHMQHKSPTARIAAVCIAVNCNSNTMSSYHFPLFHWQSLAYIRGTVVDCRKQFGLSLWNSLLQQHFSYTAVRTLVRFGLAGLTRCLASPAHAYRCGLGVRGKGTPWRQLWQTFRIQSFSVVYSDITVSFHFKTSL
jgi:hypothetical protein